MTSTIKVDNIQNQCGTDIVKRCGTTTTVGSGAGNTVVVCGSTVTIGRCGGTVSLASGASQTGFGRTGTVDWQTGSVKTATFTAVSGEGYFCNTTSSALTVNLPAGSAGAIVSVQDYNNTFDTNNLTVEPNGTEKINGGTAGDPVILETEGQGVTFVYIDSTVGWRSVQDNQFAQIGSSFVAATGGTIKTSGNFKTHIFTGPGTFTVTNAGGPGGSETVDYFVVAGGGGGSRGTTFDGGAGGGAGGFRVSNSVGCVPAPTMSPLVAPNSPTPAGLPVSVQAYPITVGGGGAGKCTPTGPGTKGVNSTFSTITSTGGGFGGYGPTPGPGGSGGGQHQRVAGTGNTPPVSPPQGNPGGTSGPNPDASPPQTPNGGGGGGAGAPGNPGVTSNGGPGGAGSYIAETFIGGCASCFGTPGPVSSTRYFAGGAGGGPSPSRGGQGASGGGDGGGAGNPGTATSNGTTNTGGGGAGNSSAAGSGGSGIVMIRYKFQ